MSDTTRMMTLSEYAVHRKVSPSTVTRAVQDGRIAEALCTTANGKRVLDWALADKLWAERAGVYIGAPR